MNKAMKIFSARPKEHFSNKERILLTRGKYFAKTQSRRGIINAAN